MKVICISERIGSPVKKGEFYYIPCDTVWIDADGDAYGEVYDVSTGKYIGQMLLKHFCSC